MLTYWLSFLIPATLALMHVRLSRGIWVGVGLLIALFVGLRWQVGGDWESYARHFERIVEFGFRDVIAYGDPGYYILNWIAGRVGADIWLANLICATVFASGLVRFLQRLPEPLLALAIAVPYLIIVLAMGYTRQATAFGFLLWAMVYLLDRRSLAFLLTIAIAAIFHKSAIIALPLAALATTHHRLTTIFWGAIASATLFALLLAEHVDRLWQGYVVSDYAIASEGGPIRVVMNVLPALLFLTLRHRFNMTREESALWFWMSVFSLVCLPLVFQAPTAVDRIALYLTPIQLIIWSHLPQLVRVGQRTYARVGVLAAYAAVLFVWLNFATHSYAWIPYKFYPLAGN